MPVGSIFEEEVGRERELVISCVSRSQHSFWVFCFVLFWFGGLLLFLFFRELLSHARHCTRKLFHGLCSIGIAILVNKLNLKVTMTGFKDSENSLWRPETTNGLADHLKELLSPGPASVPREVSRSDVITYGFIGLSGPFDPKDRG